MYYKILDDDISKKRSSFSPPLPPKTMPVTAAALQSSLCFTPHNPSSSSTSSYSIPSNLQTSNTTTQLAAKPQSILQKHPLYTPTHTKLSLQFKEKILCLEIMGVDAGKALSQNPDLHSATLDSIQAIITFLQTKGIQEKDLPKIFGMCPHILTSNIKTELTPVFKFLSDYLQVPEHNFRKVINKCPRLLASSVSDQLKPALFYLQRLGFKDLHALAYHDSVLLVSSVEKTLIPKLNFLVDLGIPRDEAVSLVLRCPALLTFSIENNYKPKYEYFSVDMGLKLEDLKEFPQYFAFSLEKRIKPRHMEVVQSGVHVPLPLMLKSTDEEFRELLKQFGGG